MKKIFAVLAAAVVALAMMPAMAFAEDGGDAPLKNLDDIINGTVPAADGTNVGYGSIKYHSEKGNESVIPVLANKGDNTIYLAYGNTPEPPASIDPIATVESGKFGGTQLDITSPGDYYLYIVNSGAQACEFSFCNIAKLAKPKITSAKPAKKSMTVKWKKVSGATKYIVHYKTGKTAKKKTAKGTSLKLTGLKSGKNYKVQVEAYKDCGTFVGKDGDTYHFQDQQKSAARSVKVK